MATILVLDDDKSVVFMVSEFLAISGHTVIRATDPVDALAKIDIGKVNLAILDYNMPAMTGTEVLKKIRGLRGGARLPVIFLTAVDPAKFYLEVAGQAGVQVLAKPIKLSLFSSTIRSMLA